MHLSVVNRKLPESWKKDAWDNLKRNWFLPISALALFFLNASIKLTYLVGMPISFLAVIFASAQIPCARTIQKQSPLTLNLASIATSAGICLHARISFYEYWSVSPYTRKFYEIFSVSFDMVEGISWIGAVCAFPFVFLCTLLFFRYLVRFFSENRLFQEIKTWEWTVYAVIFAGFLSLMVVAFSQSDAYYYTGGRYDYIYTSDSAFISSGNTYLGLAFPENDLRQPLFAAFSAPFLGISYLIGRAMTASPQVMAMLLNVPQIAVMMLADFLLARAMGLGPAKRVCFMLLSVSAYNQLLFSLMMEQYIFAFFWLSLCIYQISTKGQPERVAMVGAGGTLLTSMVLIFTVPGRNTRSNPPK